MTPTQRLQVARHPNRPTCLDIILNITDKFVELHGDRAGLDDPAVVCGIGSMDGVSFMFIGHQKGRNTKVRLHTVVSHYKQFSIHGSQVSWRFLGDCVASSTIGTKPRILGTSVIIYFHWTIVLLIHCLMPFGSFTAEKDGGSFLHLVTIVALQRCMRLACHSMIL